VTRGTRGAQILTLRVRVNGGVAEPRSKVTRIETRWWPEANA
jgi:hypothetical protein